MCLRLTKGVTHRTIFPQHEPGRPPTSQKQYSTPSSPTRNSGFWNIALWGRIWKITKPNVTLTMKISNQKPPVAPLVNRMGKWMSCRFSFLCSFKTQMLCFNLLPHQGVGLQRWEDGEKRREGSGQEGTVKSSGLVGGMLGPQGQACTWGLQGGEHRLVRQEWNNPAQEMASWQQEGAGQNPS